MRDVSPVYHASSRRRSSRGPKRHRSGKTGPRRCARARSPSTGRRRSFDRIERPRRRPRCRARRRSASDNGNCRSSFFVGQAPPTMPSADGSIAEGGNCPTVIHNEKMIFDPQRTAKTWRRSWRRCKASGVPWAMGRCGLRSRAREVAQSKNRADLFPEAPRTRSGLERTLPVFLLSR